VIVEFLEWSNGTLADATRYARVLKERR
jgi:hypothetical protein